MKAWFIRVRMWWILRERVPENRLDAWDADLIRSGADLIDGDPS